MFYNHLVEKIFQKNKELLLVNDIKTDDNSYSIHNCVQNAELKSNALNPKELYKEAIKLIGFKTKLGKRRKTRKLCQKINKKYKEKLHKTLFGLVLSKTARGSSYVCQICNKKMPFYNILFEKTFTIECLPNTSTIFYEEQK